MATNRQSLHLRPCERCGAVQASVAGRPWECILCHQVGDYEPDPEPETGPGPLNLAGWTGDDDWMFDRYCEMRRLLG